MTIQRAKKYAGSKTLVTLSPSLSRLYSRPHRNSCLRQTPYILRMQLEIVRCRCFSKNPCFWHSYMLVLQRFCYEEGRAGTKWSNGSQIAPSKTGSP